MDPCVVTRRTSSNLHQFLAGISARRLRSVAQGYSGFWLRIMPEILLALCLCALLGCTHRYRVSHYSRDIEMSIGQDVRLGAQTMRLVSVAPDGSVTIELVEEGEKFTTNPGGFFVFSSFGTEGLQLFSASPEKSTAILRQRWAEAK